MTSRERAAVLTTFIAHPGWTLVVEAMEHRKDHIIRRMTQQDVTHEERDVLAAEYRTLTTIHQWPEEQIALADDE